MIDGEGMRNREYFTLRGRLGGLRHWGGADAVFIIHSMIHVFHGLFILGCFVFPSLLPVILVIVLVLVGLFGLTNLR